MYLLIPVLVVLLCITVTYLIYYRNENSKKANGSFIEWLKFNPKEGLVVQPLLWLCILVPISLFFTFGYFAWKDYTIDFSASGFNTFLEISKLPLGVLALSLPCSALAIRVHATHQTALQLQVTEFKNKQDAYYAHEKALHESFSRMPKMTPLGFNDTYDFPVDNRLYKKLYPNNNPINGVGECSSTFLNGLEDKLVELGILIYYINTYSDSVKNLTLIANTLCRAYGCIHNICYQLHIEVPSTASPDKSLQIAGTSSVMKSESVDQLVGQFRYLRTYIINLYAFAHMELQKRDSRATHIVEQPMYVMIKRNDLVADIYNQRSDKVYNKVEFQLPPD